MKTYIVLGIVGLLMGISIGYICTGNYVPLAIPQKSQVVGFLPYWLLAQTHMTYDNSVTTLAYFGLRVNGDGKIVRYDAPGEEEPGWYALQSGKVNTHLAQAKKDGVLLSLVIFCGDQTAIAQLLSDPAHHAQTLMADLQPVMQTYGFKDLNIDIESTSLASASAQQSFTTFMQTIKQNLDTDHRATLTVDVMSTASIKPNIADLPKIQAVVDHIILMTYDYHYTGSSVTGAVAPLNGVTTDAEFDVETAVKEALRSVPPSKLLLGTPLYGYEWETLSDTPHAGVMPGSGLTVSNRRAESFIQSCATCSAHFDPVTQESYVVYKDQDTGTYHQMFYPDKQSTQAKATLAHTYKLGGLALWALGYEGDSILDPLSAYKNSFQ